MEDHANVLLRAIEDLDDYKPRYCMLIELIFHQYNFYDRGVFSKIREYVADDILFVFHKEAYDYFMKLSVNDRISYLNRGGFLNLSFKSLYKTYIGCGCIPDKYYKYINISYKCFDQFSSNSAKLAEATNNQNYIDKYFLYLIYKHITSFTDDEDKWQDICHQICFNVPYKMSLPVILQNSCLQWISEQDAYDILRKISYKILALVVNTCFKYIDLIELIEKNMLNDKEIKNIFPSIGFNKFISARPADHLIEWLFKTYPIYLDVISGDPHEEIPFDKDADGIHFYKSRPSFYIIKRFIRYLSIPKLIEYKCILPTQSIICFLQKLLSF
jgi:hypothetical protein